MKPERVDKNKTGTIKNKGVEYIKLAAVKIKRGTIKRCGNS
jgi:hypothetical protein